MIHLWAVASREPMSARPTLLQSDGRFLASSGEFGDVLVWDVAGVNSTANGYPVMKGR
jgi:hypothetical protein